jgi:predicted HicB family RNase H-like nuclease
MKELDMEIRIRRVDPNLRNDVVTVAKNKGVSVSELLEPVISKYIQSVEDKYKKPINRDLDA